MRRSHRKLAAGFLSLFSVSPLNAFVPSPIPAGQGDEQKPFITAEHAQTIYRHLVGSHWVPETGLFISFLGTGDRKLSQQASTYEQGAVGLLALRLGDIERANGIFRFLKTAWTEAPYKTGREGVNGLENFYNAEFGEEGIERTVHVGPNAWAGLFGAALGNKTGNAEATAWALDVAKWIAKDVPHRDSGVAMGPVNGTDGVPWPEVYSTENNLSYYGLLSELLKARNLSPEDFTLLTKERNQIEDWLVTTAFDRLSYAMNRGVNPSGTDRTRALDTVTWLISAVGPERLAQRGVDPDRLMHQAEISFAVKVRGFEGVDSTDQPEADLTFSLASGELVPQHVATRPHEDAHRMIWYEGLGQYINALNTMAAYSFKKSRSEKGAAYTERARQLTNEFDRAELRNYPSQTAYMYATYGKFFHDGWYAPMDAPDGAPSSLIAAVWRCYAGLGYDPLAGSDIPGVPVVEVTAPKVAKVNRSKPNVLYGTSEEMVVRAWKLLEQSDADQAILQAQATIQEWSPWATQLQHKKNRDVGHSIEYTGLPEEREKIFSYWALNDVGAAYFILGKAFDEKGHFSQAVGAFQHIALEYPLAQIWDPHGWFWSPLESVQEEYVSRDPRHYNNVLPQMLAASLTVGKQPN